MKLSFGTLNNNGNVEKLGLLIKFKAIVNRRGDGKNIARCVRTVRMFVFMVGFGQGPRTMQSVRGRCKLNCKRK